MFGGIAIFRSILLEDRIRGRRHIFVRVERNEARRAYSSVYVVRHEAFAKACDYNVICDG
jgi:hypothetical protein